MALTLAITFTELAPLIGTVGFPAAIAAFLIWWMATRLNGKLARISDSLDKNTYEIVRLTKMLTVERALRSIEGGESVGQAMRDMQEDMGEAAQGLENAQVRGAKRRS